MNACEGAHVAAWHAGTDGGAHAEERGRHCCCCCCAEGAKHAVQEPHCEVLSPLCFNQIAPLWQPAWEVDPEASGVWKQVVSLPKGRLEMKGEMLTASTRLEQRARQEGRRQQGQRQRHSFHTACQQQLAPTLGDPGSFNA